MKPESSTISPNDDRDAQIASVIEAVIRQRSLGRPMPDSESMAANPTLMPELGRKLHALSRVEQAEERAYGTDHPDRPSAQLPRDSLPGYDLMEEIHRGGQGVVYRATQIATRRQVAVKVTREGPFLGPRDKARFDREIRILAKLKHPNIVTIHDSGMAAGSHCFVMDYIDGRPRRRRRR